MLSLPRRRQRAATTGSMPDDPRYYMDFTGHGQLAQPGAPVGAAADHGLAPLLRARVPRRRLPLRPRLGARARVLRRRPPLRLLRHDPPGPGDLAGEADRRAVGRRPGRLPGRQLPGALGGVERQVPRRGARLLARPGRRRRVRAALHRLEPTSTRRTAATRSRRSTSSPPTTASRSRDLVSYNEKHNEANGEDNRDGTDDNRSLELRRRGADRRPRRCDALRAPAAAELPRDAAPLAGGADAARRRRARRARRAATTTPGARTTRSPGSTGSERRRGAARVRRGG